MNERQAGSGIGFAGALALLFIGLKLTGFVTWPWLWVLCPLWIPFAILLALLVVFAILMLVGTWDDYRKRVKREQRLIETQRERENQAAENEHGPAQRWGRSREW